MFESFGNPRQKVPASSRKYSSSTKEISKVPLGTTVTRFCEPKACK